MLTVASRNFVKAPTNRRCYNTNMCLCIEIILSVPHSKFLDFRLSPWNEYWLFDFGVFARCVKWIWDSQWLPKRRRKIHCNLRKRISLYLDFHDFPINLYPVCRHSAFLHSSYSYWTFIKTNPTDHDKCLTIQAIQLNPLDPIHAQTATIFNTRLWFQRNVTPALN
jgi:hypothetical protein